MVECLLRILANILVGLVFYCWDLRVICTLWIASLSDVSFASIFLSVCGLSSHSLDTIYRKVFLFWWDLLYILLCFMCKFLLLISRMWESKWLLHINPYRATSYKHLTVVRDFLLFIRSDFLHRPLCHLWTKAYFFFFLPDLYGFYFLFLPYCIRLPWWLRG